MTCEVDEACYGDCPECKAWESEVDVVDEDWLTGVTCNPDEPELCESCQ